MQVTGIINSVTPRPAGGTTIYDVDISGTVYSTFNPAAMRQAQEHLGQQGTFEVNIKPSKDGQFQNYFFEGLAGQVPAKQQRGGGAPGLAQGGIPIAQPSGGMSPEREQKIVKQSSMSTAFNFYCHLYEGSGPEMEEEVKAKAWDLAKEMYAQVMNVNPSPTLDDQVVQALVEAAPPAPPQNEIPDW